jgi:uncharacterized coiled-coil protein SlyX
MNNEPSSLDPSDSAALIILEEKLTFQQRQLDQLNAVVLEQQAELHRLRLEHDRLAEVARGWPISSSEDLPHEKPPHY